MLVATAKGMALRAIAKAGWRGEDHALNLAVHILATVVPCIRAYDPVRSGDIEVEVVSPVFVDPEGVRLRA